MASTPSPEMKQTESYIIGSTPRSGSTLLCDLLFDTGVAGQPHSYFRREDISWWAEQFDVSVVNWRNGHEFDQAYLAAVLRQGDGGTRVFGLRLMWESVADLSKRLDSFYPNMDSDSARFKAAFGTPVYLHLSREDKVAQAVSLLRAEQTGLWHVNADGTERERLKEGHAPVYDAQDLSRLVTELEEHDRCWTRWFHEQGIRPVRITYEGLVADPQATLATVLSALGLDPGIAEAVEPRTAKLADLVNREWTTRFRTERRKSPD